MTGRSLAALCRNPHAGSSAKNALPIRVCEGSSAHTRPSGGFANHPRSTYTASSSPLHSTPKNTRSSSFPGDLRGDLPSGPPTPPLEDLAEDRIDPDDWNTWPDGACPTNPLWWEWFRHVEQLYRWRSRAIVREMPVWGRRVCAGGAGGRALPFSTLHPLRGGNSIASELPSLILKSLLDTSE